MNPTRRRAIVSAGLLGLASAGAWAWKPRTFAADGMAKVDLETLFPKEFGPWRVDDRVLAPLVSPDVEALLNRLYHQTLSRTYVNNAGQRIMLSVAYGGDQSDATRAHRPEVCYPAQGFQVLANSVSTLDIGRGEPLPVRRLLTRMGGRVEPVTYWMLVGERVALTGTQQKLMQLRYTTRGVVPDGMLVRVSSIDTEAARAYALHEVFVSDMASFVPTGWQARVFGRDSAAPAA